MKFRPCIDLHQGQVKQIVGGSLTDDSHGLIENFVAEHDAAYYAGIFKKDGLSGGHVIMLGPNNETQVRQALNVFPGGLQVGGGIRPENAEQYLKQGASHVIVTSYIFEKGELHQGNLEAMKAAAGREHLVLDLSCRQKDEKYYVVTDRWQRFTHFEVNYQNLSELATYCAEFLIHGVDVEGKRQGIEENLVSPLGEWAMIPVTYAGGARNLADLDLVNQLGKGKIDLTIGSALDIFGGSLPYRQVIEWNDCHK